MNINNVDAKEDDDNEEENYDDNDDDGNNNDGHDKDVLAEHVDENEY